MSKHEQAQFLEVIDRDEAERRFTAAIDFSPPAVGKDLIAAASVESVPLSKALGRVLAADVASPVDVPSFDRSNFDGFAVRAADTFGASETEPRRLQLLDAAIATGMVPECEVAASMAVPIATGAMVPRGADAVIMIEHTEVVNGEVVVRKAVATGSGIAFAGTDIARGQTVLYGSQLLTSRETGVLAAIGVSEVSVRPRVRVAIVSTGDEILAPGEAMRPGLVYDSNAQILADAVRELGAEPQVLGIVQDDLEKLRRFLRAALETADVVVLSGGTSKGHGDLCYRVVAEETNPGIVAHGVALKPGKPICLAAHHGKPVVILPGFPTSAIFTFHEFVAPAIRRLGGMPAEERATVTARLAVKVNSQIGRTEYLLVGLVHGEGSELVAYPMGKGSGSVTTFSHADGFITIGRQEEIVESGSEVVVQRLGRDLVVADLVVIGSHCIGLDYLLGRLQAAGFATKFFAVGSTAGLAAAQRGECDLAGIHLLDENTGEYNRPFVGEGLELVAGYARQQGVVFRRGDARFEDRSAAGAIAAVKGARDCVMVNRNRGSGTRILIDQLLGPLVAGEEPAGYAVQASNHSAVAAAVAQGRADWGVTISHLAEKYELGFLPLRDEQFDFVVPQSRAGRPAVVALRELLADEETRAALRELGLRI